MKKIARNKLNAIFKKSGFLTIEKIMLNFKDCFFIIYNTTSPFDVSAIISENRYTFLSISLHFHYHSTPPLSILNEQLYLAICSFDHKLRFQRSSLYRETSYQRSVIQLPKIDKAISVTKHLQFAQKAFIMNKNPRLGLVITIQHNRLSGKEEHYAYSSNTGYR